MYYNLTTCTIISLHVLYVYSGSSTSDPTVLHVLPLMVHVPVHATTATTTTATCTCDIGGPAGFRSRFKRRAPRLRTFFQRFFSSQFVIKYQSNFGFNLRTMHACCGPAHFLSTRYPGKIPNIFHEDQMSNQYSSRTG